MNKKNNSYKSLMINDLHFIMLQFEILFVVNSKKSCTFAPSHQSKLLKELRSRQVIGDSCFFISSIIFVISSARVYSLSWLIFHSLYSVVFFLIALG